MESCGGSGDGKEKTPWTTSTIVENRGKWNLGADVELLWHLKSFSDRISSQLESTSQALDSLEADLATTCVGVHLVSNHFLSLADSQFVENRVYDDEESTNEDKKVGESVKKSKEEEEADRFNKKKSAIANGLEVLRANFIPVEIPNIDSDDDDDVDDGDGAPVGIVYKPINPFENRPLPHLIGSKEFLIDPYVGIKSRLTDDEEEEDDDDDDGEELDEESSDKSSTSKAFSVHEDSEPESDRVNLESTELKPDALEKSGLSFAEHLTARLEGMKFESKLDASSDDSLPSAAPTNIPTSIIDTPYEPVVRPYDNKTDRYYDNGFDDRYDDYDDSIFARNSRDQTQDNDFEEEDLFLPNDDRNLESPIWGKSNQPVIPNKQSLIKDLENKLEKDSNPSDLSNSSPPSNRVMNRATRPSDLFSDNGNDDSEGIFSATKGSEPIKKKIPAGAVSIFGSNVDPFGNSSKTEKGKQDTTSRAQSKMKPDIVSSLKSSNSDNIDNDEEDSLFTSGIEKTSSKNSSTKLSDSFHDDNLSIRSNKSSALFESDTIPPASSTKAIDDLFKDIDAENDDDDDLFSSYFTKSKKENFSSTSTGRTDNIFSSSASSKPKAVVDDLFGDFKDDLFASIKDESKTTSSANKTNVSKTKIPNLFSDSDSDSEFISSKKSYVNRVQEASIHPPVTSSEFPKQQVNSKSLFSDDSSHKLTNDIFSIRSTLKSKNVDVKIDELSKQGKSDDLFGSAGKDVVKSVTDKDLFKDIDNSDTKPKTVPSVKDSRSNTKKSLSIFDDVDSDGDDGLFGISSSKKSNKLKSMDEEDLFSQPSSSKQGAQHSSSNVDENSEPQKFPTEKEYIQSTGKRPIKSAADLNVPPHPSSSKKTVEDYCDDLFSTNTSASVEIKTTIPKFEDSESNNKIIDRKEETIVARVDDPLFDDSYDIQTSNTPSIETKTDSDGPLVAHSTADSLFGGFDDDSTDIFSNLGKSGFKSSKSNNEKTASSVPSSIITDKKKGGFSVLQDDNDDGLFSETSKSFASEPSLVDDKKSTSISVEKGLLSDADQNKLSEAKVELQKDNEVEVKKSLLGGIFEENKSDSLDFLPSTDPPRSKSGSSFESDPLSSLQTATKPNISVKPQPPSKPKPEKSSKPSPPKTLNLPAPISVNDHIPDATDGGIISSEPKVESPKKITPGKLNFQKTLNIDPKALLPGAQPKFKKPSNVDVLGEKGSENEDTLVETGGVPDPQIVATTTSGKVKAESEGKVSPMGVLTNVNKDRARIQVKRRPQTRKARREALRHSTFEEDETDNSSSIATQSLVDHTSSSVEPSNVLSPSTDEDDLFGVPPLDLPPDYSKVSTSPGDLFAVPTTVLSPGLSIKENDFPVDNISSENPPDKHSNDNIFENSLDKLHSIPSAGFDDDFEDEKTSKYGFNNSSSLGLFDDDNDYSSFGVDIIHKKVHSDSKIPTEIIQKSVEDEDEEADLFSNKPNRPREETPKKVENLSNRNLSIEPDLFEDDSSSIGVDSSHKKVDSDTKIPSKINQKSGEDDEADLFSNRAKETQKKVENSSRKSLNIEPDLFEDNFSSTGFDESHKKVDSDTKIPEEIEQENGEDDEADLFSNKPNRIREESKKKVDTLSSKSFSETEKIEQDPLASGLNSSEKMLPLVLSDEEDLFSTVSVKKDEKVVASQENATVSGLVSSSNVKKDKGKEITQSLFSSDGNNDDIFQTVSSAVPKMKSGNLGDDSQSKVKSVANVSSKIEVSGSLFEDEDEDLFGGKPKNRSKQPTVTKPSVGDKLFVGDSVTKSKKSIFDDDDDSDIFSTSKAGISKESQSAASKGSKSVSKKSTDMNSRSSKSNLLKTDSQQPFIDPLSNLDKEQ